MLLIDAWSRSSADTLAEILHMDGWTATVSPNATSYDYTVATDAQLTAVGKATVFLSKTWDWNVRKEAR